MIRAFFVSENGKSFSRDFYEFDDFMRFKKASSKAGVRLVGYYSIED